MDDINIPIAHKEAENYCLTLPTFLYRYWETPFAEVIDSVDVGD